jgi:hypothetical protein
MDDIKTVLTDEQKAQFVTDICNYGTDFVTPLFAIVDSIERTVLAASEQAVTANAPAVLGADDDTPAQEIAGLKAVVKTLGQALGRLSFAAQTSGGTDGRDEELVDAINWAERAMSIGGIGRAYCEGADSQPSMQPSDTPAGYAPKSKFGSPEMQRLIAENLATKFTPQVALPSKLDQYMAASQEIQGCEYEQVTQSSAEAIRNAALVEAARLANSDYWGWNINLANAILALKSSAQLSAEAFKPDWADRMTGWDDALEAAIEICAELNDQTEVGTAFDNAIDAIRAMKSTARPVDTQDAVDAKRYRTLRDNMTFYNTNESSGPVLASVSARIWYHATDNLEYPIDAVIDALQSSPEVKP